MGKPEEDYHYIIVETYRISGSGLHDDIHVRPVEGEMYPQSLHLKALNVPRQGLHLLCGRFDSGDGLGFCLTQREDTRRPLSGGFFVGQRPSAHVDKWHLPRSKKTQSTVFLPSTCILDIFLHAARSNGITPYHLRPAF